MMMIMIMTDESGGSARFLVPRERYFTDDRWMSTVSAASNVSVVDIHQLPLPALS